MEAAKTQNQDGKWERAFALICKQILQEIGAIRQITNHYKSSILEK